MSREDKDLRLLASSAAGAVHAEVALRTALRLATDVERGNDKREALEHLVVLLTELRDDVVTQLEAVS